mmetsp:Transcript_104617/g.327330  ORF Transcript_104617/g.327330 Transcript_104617/m.327330 type:complete len:239 (+) Transcript_104617:580-1296(+)
MAVMPPAPGIDLVPLALKDVLLLLLTVLAFALAVIILGRRLLLARLGLCCVILELVLHALYAPDRLPQALQLRLQLIVAEGRLGLALLELPEEALDLVDLLRLHGAGEPLAQGLQLPAHLAQLALSRAVVGVQLPLQLGQLLPHATLRAGAVAEARHLRGLLQVVLGLLQRLGLVLREAVRVDPGSVHGLLRLLEGRLGVHGHADRVGRHLPGQVRSGLRRRRSVAGVLGVRSDLLLR